MRGNLHIFWEGPTTQDVNISPLLITLTNKANAGNLYSYQNKLLWW